MTGQILHGKTSPLRHNDRGVYHGLPQNLPVTRYHSLAGTHATLPDCLEVSSWIASGPDGGKGIIMGVRHKTLLVEGVQFHPESILTEHGRPMLRNFLHMRGGTWAENIGWPAESEKQCHAGEKPVPNGLTFLDPTRQTKESILEKIYRHRKQAVEAQKNTPSQRPSDLQSFYDLGLSPPLISFPDRLKSSPYTISLLAEIKRASPSKGSIAANISAPAQARKYAIAGASVISVLTEPEWFEGSIEDLRAVRQSLEGLDHRPAVLRKEFIFEEYQILEARTAGADTILLIVKMLDQLLLERLYKYAQSMGMEPIVEVNTVLEMQIAVQLGCQVIGVNNRNLANFEVDLNTTSRLMANVPTETTVCALSGISGPNDVQSYKSQGVGGVLVGEALMRALDVQTFVKSLLGTIDHKIDNFVAPKTLVKICGTREPQTAKLAIEAGADMIGIILVEGRKRYVPPHIAIAISRVVHETKKSASFTNSGLGPTLRTAIDFFDHTTDYFRNHDRALLIGVFQNQPLSHILAQQRMLRLDAVQLHGSEPIEWSSLIPVPVIRRCGPTDPGLHKRGYHALPLIDSAGGGTGEPTDITQVREQMDLDVGLRIILAGGLNPDNVAGVLQQLEPHQTSVVAVDVSSGVEQNGEQSLEKIKGFILAVKTIC